MMTRSFTLVAALALAAARRNDEGWSHVGDAADDVQIELAFASNVSSAISDVYANVVTLQASPKRDARRRAL